MATSKFLSDLFSLEGQVALVTGASSGLGRRMAEALAHAGAHVALVARRREALGALVSDIKAAGRTAAACVADLAHEDSIEELAAQAARELGAPSILVNAAGVNLREPPETISWESWNRTLHLNLSVPFFLARALVPGMVAQGGGTIINIASLQSERAFPNSMPYGASKGGVTQLTRAMAEAWSRHGVRANAILPGLFPTELTQSVFADPAVAQKHAQATAIGRNGELADLDGITIFLASKASAFVTGQVIAIDGGYLAK
jgi:NAD(P)-dependent dehydrogenase (short-subunit alcohol dehydrogenase family)